MNFDIDLEFRALIPPLSEKEKELLEQSVLEDGIREAIVVWAGTIIDGHHRYELAKKHNLRFEFIEMGADLSSREEVMEWMINNQLGRRNLTDLQRLELVQKKAALWRKKGKESQGTRTDLLSKNDKKLAHNTQAKVAAELGWSTGKVAMGEKVLKEAPSEIKEAARKGEMSLSKAYQETRAQKIRQAKVERMAKANEKPWPAAEIELRKRLDDGETIVINIDKQLHIRKYAEEKNLLVIVDRSTDWGNPYVLNKDGDVQWCLDGYKNHLKYKRSLYARIDALTGKALGCHCAPNPCHGNYLAQLANERT